MSFSVMVVVTITMIVSLCGNEPWRFLYPAIVVLAATVPAGPGQQSYKKQPLPPIFSPLIYVQDAKLACHTSENGKTRIANLEYRPRKQVITKIFIIFLANPYCLEKTFNEVTQNGAKWLTYVKNKWSRMEILAKWAPLNTWR